MQLELYPPAGPFRMVLIDLFGVLHRAMTGNYFVVIITDIYNKLKRFISTARITSKQVTKTFYYDLVIAYGTVRQ